MIRKLFLMLLMAMMTIAVNADDVNSTTDSETTTTYTIYGNFPTGYAVGNTIAAPTNVTVTDNNTNGISDVTITYAIEGVEGSTVNGVTTYTDVITGTVLNSDGSGTAGSKIGSFTVVVTATKDGTVLTTKKYTMTIVEVVDKITIDKTSVTVDASTLENTKTLYNLGLQPTVKVMHGSDDVTSNYTITYSISSATSGVESTDEQGNAYTIYTDPNTGTTVRSTDGNVTIGQYEGTFTVKATATEKNPAVGATANELTIDYDLTVKAEGTISIEIGSYTKEQAAGETKFQEPTVRVTRTVNKGVNSDNSVATATYSITSDYSIVYSLCGGGEDGHTHSEIGADVEESNGTYRVDNINLGTKVNKSTGDVIIGKQGTAYILITATANEGAIYETAGTTHQACYAIKATAGTTDFNFVTELKELEGEENDEYNDDNDYVGKIILQPYVTADTDNEGNKAGTYTSAGAAAMLPAYTIKTTINKTENNAGVETDITDMFTLEKTFMVNTSATDVANGSDYLRFTGDYLAYNEFKNCAASGDNAYTAIDKMVGTLTYTFTSTTAAYSSFEKKVLVTVAAHEETSAKSTVKLEYKRAMFPHDNVTIASSGNENDGDTIHVYKYGLCDDGSGHHYKYTTPVPALIDNEGTILPIGSKSAVYNKFRLAYTIVEGKDSTYYDDCDYMPHSSTGSSVIQKAGEKTGISVEEDYISGISKPGLIKVRVEAIYPTSPTYQNYSELPNIYQPLEAKDADGVVIKDANGNVTYKTINIYGEDYYVYSDPVYFYVDVMHRRPTMVLSPNPEDIAFLTGESLTLADRFELTAYIDDSSNTEAETLDWETGNYTYQFFISERMRHFVTLSSDVDSWKTSWEEGKGDVHSYWDMHKVLTAYANTTDTNGNTIDVESIMVGDSIYVKDDEGYKALAEDSELRKQVNEYGFVKIKADSIDYWKEIHPTIQVGDYEVGITYNSMKDWKNEDWKLTFLYDGYYTIPYTFRSWNPVKWCNATEIGIKFWFSSNVLIDTRIKLSYDYQVAEVKQDPFNEPTAKVVVPLYNDLDVTDQFTLSYEFVTSDSNPLYDWSSWDEYYEVVKNVSNETWNVDNSIAKLTSGVVTFYNNNGDIQQYKGSWGTCVVAYYLDCATGTKLYPNGKVVIGDKEGEVSVRVSAMRNSYTSKYNNPSPATYTIKIVGKGLLAGWEIINTSNTSGNCTLADSRYATDEDKDNYNGKMHFIKSGIMYGGYTFSGAPGISMDLGVPSTTSASEWYVITRNASMALTSKILTTSYNVGSCCNHDVSSEGSSDVDAVVVCAKNVTLKKGIPTAGAFYQFNPSVNGFLTIDACFEAGHNYVLVYDAGSGEVVTDTIYADKLTLTQDADNNNRRYGEAQFTHPLLAGTTYYLYDAKSPMQLHGFLFTPAFINDRSTTLAESKAPLSASTFMNGLSSLMPSILNGTTNANVKFKVANKPYNEDTSITSSDYLTIADTTGVFNPVAMTIDTEGNVFKLKITATVNSTITGLYKDACLALRILDIPTFAITSASSDNNYQVGDIVSTTNIPTDITMTFGGWTGTYEDGTKGKYVNASGKELTDSWGYKGGNRMVTTVDGEDYDWGGIIDGFEYTNVGGQNALDENNNSYATYNWKSGVAYEDTCKSAYTVPARGAYLKFEPRESGTLLIYLVQNGSVDYYEGISSIGTSYQIKWRPLYIVDQTGKPVTMVNSFGSSVSGLLASGEDATNQGSYTLCVSRCSKLVDKIMAIWGYESGKLQTSDYGLVCADEQSSFDWSAFRGTLSDKAKLLEAWKSFGERESIIRLDNGGYALPHKGWVRYAFNVKAGKTYYVFQNGSKPEFGGFSFVPEGFPNHCKYQMKWQENSDGTKTALLNADNQEKYYNDGAPVKISDVTAENSTTTPTYQGVYTDDNNTNINTDLSFTWDVSTTKFFSSGTDATEFNNINVIINDRRRSEILENSTYNDKGTLKAREFKTMMYEGICFPFSVSETQCKNIFGDGYVLLTCDGMRGDTIHFVRHANGYIEAGRPYLLRPKKNGVFKFDNVTIENLNTVNDDGTPQTDPTRFDVKLNDYYTFKGRYVRSSLPQYSYYVYNTGLFRNNYTNQVIGGYRSFFEYGNGTLSSAAKAFTMSIDDLTPDPDLGDDSTTSIVIVNGDGEITAVPEGFGIYSINGQKIGDSPLELNNAPSGVYIINGKKVVK